MRELKIGGNKPPDESIDEVSEYVDDLRAAEIDDEPLSADDVASIELGLEDLRQGRVKSIEDYRREREREPSS